jgi:hypothetical protein
VGRDLEEFAVTVLSTGLPPLPGALDTGMPVPIAVWRGDRFGAVLFARLWTNGNVDGECTLVERAAAGDWGEVIGSGGGGWIDDPLVRNETGWRGDPVLWIGSSGIGLTPDEVDPEPPFVPVHPRQLGVSRPQIVRVPEGLDDEQARAHVDQVIQQQRRRREARWDTLDLRVLRGVASTRVRAIEVEQGNRRWEIPIDSPCGAFLVGLEQPGPAKIRVLGHGGRPLADADGQTEHTAASL